MHTTLTASKITLLSVVDDIQDPQTPSPEYFRYLGQQDGEEVFSLADFRQMIEESPQTHFTFDELLPESTTSGKFWYLWGDKAVIVGNIFKQALAQEGSSLPTQRFDGDLTVSGKMIVNANLIVNGNIILDEDADLVVLGSIQAELIYEETYSYCQIVGVGDVSARAIAMEGNLTVGGKLTSDFVYVHFNQAMLRVLNGIAAKLFIENDHGGSHVWGECQIEALFYDEMQGFEALDRANEIDQLQHVLLAEHWEKIRQTEDPDLDEIADELFDLLRENEPVFQ